MIGLKKKVSNQRRLRAELPAAANKEDMCVVGGKFNQNRFANQHYVLKQTELSASPRASKGENYGFCRLPSVGRLYQSVI